MIAQVAESRSVEGFVRPVFNTSLKLARKNFVRLFYCGHQNFDALYNISIKEYDFLRLSHPDLDLSRRTIAIEKVPRKIEAKIGK